MKICSHEQMFQNSPVAMWLCSVLSFRVSARKTPRNSASSLLHREKEQVQQPPTDQPQDHTPCRAKWNDTKNCPTSDLGSTIFLLILPLLSILIFLSPSHLFLLYPLCQHQSASCSRIPHLKHDPLKPPSPFALDSEQLVSVTILILLVLIRVTILFFRFRFRNIQTHWRHIHWNRSILRGSGNVRARAHT